MKSLLLTVSLTFFTVNASAAFIPFAGPTPSVRNLGTANFNNFDSGEGPVDYQFDGRAFGFSNGSNQLSLTQGGSWIRYVFEEAVDFQIEEATTGGGSNFDGDGVSFTIGSSPTAPLPTWDVENLTTPSDMVTFDVSNAGHTSTLSGLTAPLTSNNGPTVTISNGTAPSYSVLNDFGSLTANGVTSITIVNATDTAGERYSLFIQSAAIPEPSSVAMLFGLAAVGLLVARKRH